MMLCYTYVIIINNTLFVEYVDTTLPQVGPNGERYSITDTLDIIGTTSVGSGYPFIKLS